MTEKLMFFSTVCTVSVTSVGVTDTDTIAAVTTIGITATANNAINTATTATTIPVTLLIVMMNADRCSSLLLSLC